LIPFFSDVILPVLVMNAIAAKKTVEEKRLSSEMENSVVV